MSTLPFSMLYLSFLRISQVVINPFGRDDDDFETQYLIDRHIKALNEILCNDEEEQKEEKKKRKWRAFQSYKFISVVTISQILSRICRVINNLQTQDHIDNPDPTRSSTQRSQRSVHWRILHCRCSESSGTSASRIGVLSVLSWFCSSCCQEHPQPEKLKWIL